jgi:hypothetical protein
MISQVCALVANAQHADKVIDMTISFGNSDAADLATGGLSKGPCP